MMKMLLAHGILHGGEMTITGRTVAENLAEVPEVPRKDQNVIRQWDNPMYAEGHLAILRGNLATEGAVAKVTGIKHKEITGPARVFDREEDTLEAILAGKIVKGDVIVIRYEGPKGGPGMRETLADLGDHRCGPGRFRRADYRRTFLGRHLRAGGRPRRARSRGGRGDCAGEGRGLDNH